MALTGVGAVPFLEKQHKMKECSFIGLREGERESRGEQRRGEQRRAEESRAEERRAEQRGRLGTERGEAMSEASLVFFFSSQNSTALMFRYSESDHAVGLDRQWQRLGPEPARGQGG